MRFKACEGDGCESKENIREWLKRKYIVILYNQIRFDSTKYFKDSRVAESRIAYIPISSQNREVISYKIQKTNLELQDNDVIMLDELTLTDFEDLFTIRKYDVLPYELTNNNWMSVSFEMDLNLIHIERKLYTVFDMLSDVGGLLGILTTIAAFLNTIWNFQAFDNFMVSRLFKIKRPKDEIMIDAGFF